MYRKWKSMFALGMAVLIGCSMPMGTMLAAEENPEAVQEVEADSASDTDAAYDDETVLDDDGNVVDADDEKVEDEVNVEDDENVGDEADADDEIADDEVVAEDDENAGIMVMSAADAEAGDQEVQVHTAAPVIDITLNGESCKVDGLGGDINYKYTNNSKLELSASQGDTKISFCYWLDSDPGVKAKDDIEWSDECYPSVTHELSNNKTYVVYVKAEANGQTVYARSCGIVVDTEVPEVTGVTDGGTCPEGTTFKVSDTNLDSVTVNGKSVALAADGNYQVTAAGTTCVIIAKDKAGNTTTCSITVTARNLEENGVISVSGTYYLKPGVSYKLGEGKWQVGGDKSVYAGGNTFYVGTDGNYSFTKR